MNNQAITDSQTSALLEQQLNRIIKDYQQNAEKDFQKLLGTERQKGEAGQFSDTWYWQKWAMHEKNARDLFQKVAKQIAYMTGNDKELFITNTESAMNELNPEKRNKERGNNYFNQDNYKGIENENFNKIVELRSYYADQLEYGFIDGIKWNNYPEQVKMAQIQNINYTFNIKDGSHHQIIAGESEGIQHNNHKKII
jgi:hypothetical protein